MSQSLSSILVHLIFSTKHREPFLTPEIDSELHAYMGTVFRELDSPALAINGTADHIHALFRLSRKISLADLIEEVKKRPSKWLKTKGDRFKNFYWQAGYGAFSIGESMVQSVRKYIANQKEHHRKKSFQDEFRSFLSKYRIEYDERYVWD